MCRRRRKDDGRMKGDLAPFRAGTRAFGDDGLTAGQHVDERSDLLRAASWRLHLVRAKRQREEVLASKRPECLARARIRVDGGAQIRGDGGFGRAADRVVGGVPAAIGFRGIHMALTVRGHAPFCRQPRHVIAIDLDPDTLGAARAVALQERLLVERLPRAVGQIRLPQDWDEERVRRVFEHYVAQSDEEAVAEDEAAYEPTTHTR